MNSMYTMSVDSFVPMLESLSAILDKSALTKELDLPNARLAPDMYTLSQQVQQACFYAENGVARLTGREAVNIPMARTTLAEMKMQIATTLESIRAVSATEFDSSSERDCSIEIPDDRVIEMDGLRFLRSWTLPHFYFHVVTAYDILRNCGINIGKMDYLSQVGGFIRPRPA
jgi:uncharacterized protein